ncbi:MAG TPA: rhodanese-like domain-containing protein [Chitinophagaceae bacterium]|nr:rhodanese-like domain-containing protein [Chitinophagaceae bacterium]HNU15474.1 rhodanese-like domain-containing protein [Chitinophagaceae bacterium]
MLGFLKKIFGGTSVNYKELVSNGAIIVDVRSPGEYKAGHIPGSKNFPLDNIRSKVAELKKINKPVITVCRSGARSGMAKSILQSAGIEVYNGGPWTSLKNKIAS